MKIVITDRIKNPDIEENILNQKISLTPSIETECLLVWHEVVDKAYIDSLPNLKLIQRYGVGYDKIDIEYAKSKGIIVCNNPDYCTEEVSDTALAMMLAASRGVFKYNVQAKNYHKGWQENTLKNLKRIHHSTVGFIGAGRIGYRTMALAKAIGYNIIFFDPYQTPGMEKIINAKRVHSLKELLNESDIVSIHTPLTSETKGMINEEFINQMKDGSILINTARGTILEDLDLLIPPIKTGKLFTVCLDVLPEEPPKNSQLFNAWKNGESWAVESLIINPHSSYYSQESSIEMREKVAQNIKKFYDAKILNSIIN